MRRLAPLLLILASCNGAAATATTTTSGSDAAGSGSKACVSAVAPLHACQARWCDNPKGVGRPCTKGGGECNLNKALGSDLDLPAVICTAAYSTTDQFCTLPCGSDEDCGAGAVCAGDPDNPKSGKGCMLAACLGSASTATTDAGSSDASGADAGSD